MYSFGLDSLYEKDTFIEETFQRLVKEVALGGLSLSSSEKKFLAEVYYFVEEKYKGRKRKDNSDEFSHMLDVTFSFLKHFDVVTFEDIVICLLHDVLEDFPDMIVADLEEQFGHGIVDKIKKLTKKDWLYYVKDCNENDFSSLKDKLNFSELKENVQIGDIGDFNVRDRVKQRLRDLRNEDYFGSMETLDESLLKIKVVDRICSLRTIKGFGDKEKIQVKIEETQKYFLTPRIKKLFPKEFLEIGCFCAKLKVILEVDDAISKDYLHKNYL